MGICFLSFNTSTFGPMANTSDKTFELSPDRHRLDGRAPSGEAIAFYELLSFCQDKSRKK